MVTRDLDLDYFNSKELQITCLYIKQRVYTKSDFCLVFICLIIIFYAETEKYIFNFL